MEEMVPVFSLLYGSPLKTQVKSKLLLTPYRKGLIDFLLIWEDGSDKRISYSF